jgi:hypothetical protein
MSGNGGMVGAQAIRGGGQGARARNSQKMAQIIPVVFGLTTCQNLALCIYAQ